MAFNKPKAAPEKKKTSILRILGVVAVVVVAVAMPIFETEQMIDDALVNLIGNGSTYTMSSMRPTLTGSKATSVKISTSSEPITVGEINVTTGFLRMLQGSFTLDQSEIDNARIDYRNIQDPAGLLREEQMIWESMGCGDQSSFGDEDYAAMGLTPGENKASVEFEPVFETLKVFKTFQIKGIGSTTEAITYKGTEPGKSALNLYKRRQPMQIVEASWSFQDEGFIPKRNEFCAKKLNVSVEQFLAYHVASIDRTLRTEGLSATPELWNQYMSFARNGGQLVFAGTFTTDVSMLESLDADMASLLPAMKIDSVYGASRVPVELATQEPQSWDNLDEELTAFQVVQKEGGLKALTVQDAIYTATVSNNPNAQAANETVVVKGDAGPERSEIRLIYREEPEYITSFAGLAAARGRRVRIERSNGPDLTAIVTGMTAKGVQLRVNRAGGYADLTLAPTGFKRAIILPK
jgi:hypothetical protein